MPTFPGTAAGPRFELGRIIALTLWLAAAALLLGACSTTRLAYNRAPTFAYWWLDGYVDFTDAQSPVARADIDRFFAWHRGTELPLYAQRLSRWQTLAQKDLGTEQACHEFEAVRASVNRMSERALAPLTTLALQLTPAQLDHMQRHQTKSDQSFEKDFLRGTPAQRLERRFERAIDRYESLYGPLTEPQRRQLRTRLLQSPWDPQRTRAERQRRQAVLLQVVREVQASHASDFAAGGARLPPPEAVAVLRNGWQRLLDSPAPGDATYNAALVNDGCAQFAALHNSTSAEQRAHAVGVLKGYEGDLRALMAAD